MGATPDASEVIGSRRRLWPRGHEGGIERAKCGADEHVRGYPMLIERPDHADVERSKTCTARQYKGRAWRPRADLRAVQRMRHYCVRLDRAHPRLPPHNSRVTSLCG